MAGMWPTPRPERTGPSLSSPWAKVKLASVRGERVVDLDTFFVDIGKTVLDPDEILTEVVVPVQGKTNRWTWHKLGQRKASVCAVISLAMALELRGGVCSRVRIALGTVAPTPFLAREAGARLEGKALTPTLIEEAAVAALADALASMRETWEGETTARNLRLIREARERRDEPMDGAEEIERALTPNHQ